MFSKLTFLLSALALTALATPTPSDEPASKCNSGPVQCCASLQPPADPAASHQLGLLGIAVQSVTGQVGLECNPITVIGAGTGANCASHPVCCEKNFSNQLVGINCTPITVGA